MQISLNEIFAVIDKVKETELHSFEYCDVDMKIKIKNSGGKNGNKKTNENIKRDDKSVERETSLQETEFCSAQIQEEKSTASVKENEEKNFIDVKSFMIGTFYAAPSEGAEPFVKVGDKVKKGQVVGLIEAMKLMNEVEADTDGVVEEIFAENEMMVEFGQPIMRIRYVGN